MELHLQPEVYDYQPSDVSIWKKSLSMERFFQLVSRKVLEGSKLHMFGVERNFVATLISIHIILTNCLHIVNIENCFIFV